MDGLRIDRGTLAAPHDAFTEDAMTAQHADPSAHYTLLGSIESSAPTAALLATLQTLRPQWLIRLVLIESSATPRYRVEVGGAPAHDSEIDAWLHIKSALMATYPADKPHAVTATDP
jgi:hypothetical protein